MQVVRRARQQKLDRSARMRTAIVDAAEKVEMLLLQLDDQDRGARLARRRLQAGGELQPRQVAGKQHVALDGAHIDRPLGRDHRRVVGEEVAVAPDRFRPFDPLDIAFDDLQAGNRAVRTELLRRHDGARQRVAVIAVFRGDALGEIVDRLQRHILTDQVGPERRELILAVDGRAANADVADGDPDLRRPGGRFGAWQDDRRRAGLREWRTRLEKTLSLPPGLLARGNDLSEGGDR